MIKLVALDLDGTLLDEKREIPQATKTRLIDLKNRGVKIILATGRSFETAKRYYYELELDTPFIGLNGGVIYQPNQEHLFKAAAFSREDFLKVAEELESLGLFYQYYSLHCVYADRLAHGVKRWHCENEHLPEAWQMRIQIEKDPIAWARTNYEPIYKILARAADQEKLDEVIAMIDAMPGLDTVSSLSLALDIGPDNCDKGNALEMVGKILGISPEDMMAMGDNDNDREMIAYAGVGVAMGDASKEAKAAADYCTSLSDGPGVLQALDRFI